MAHRETHSPAPLLVTLAMSGLVAKSRAAFPANAVGGALRLEWLGPAGQVGAELTPEIVFKGGAIDAGCFDRDT